ncbi:MAG: 2,3,4,5-tetrahydropyridine-2,6-dicarboxylate N-succinyltransferase [Mycobacteriales bacterium]
MSGIDPVIDELWDRRDQLAGDREARELVRAAVDALDRGHARVARIEPDSDEVVVDERAKRAILLAFTVFELVESSGSGCYSRDRIPLKTSFDAVRVVPGAVIRWGSYVAPGAVLMPCFVNIGGYVGEATMVDTWATVGSCAQIGARVHLSGGVGIGGVLEPPNAVPVVVEDDALIGSRSMITDGARVGRGAVVGSGVILNPSIPVIDAASGAELSRGRVPDWCVAVAATRARDFTGGSYGLPCVLVIKRLQPEQRHDKAQLNEVLRAHQIAT